MRKSLLGVIALAIACASVAPSMAATISQNQGATNIDIMRGTLNPFVCLSSDPEDEASANAINIRTNKVSSLDQVVRKRFYDLKTTDNNHNHDVVSGLIWQNVNYTPTTNSYFGVSCKGIGCDTLMYWLVKGIDSNGLPTTVKVQFFVPNDTSGIGTTVESFAEVQTIANIQNIPAPVTVSTMVLVADDSSSGECGAEYYAGDLNIFEGTQKSLGYNISKLYTPATQTSLYAGGTCPDPTINTDEGNGNTGL